MYVQSQIHQLWESVEERKNKSTLLKKMIETEERMIALEKAVEIQVNTSSLYSYISAAETVHHFSFKASLL